MRDYSFYRHYLQQLDWRTDFNQLPDLQRQWLVRNDSLTKALQEKYSHLTVIPLYEGWNNSTYHSYNDIDITYDRYWLREVFLVGNGQPVIFAHTVIPPNTFYCYAEKITRIGKQPIGKWLFQQPIMRRQLMWGAGDIGFARRSTLMLGESPFFISELFLDEFWGKK